MKCKECGKVENLENFSHDQQAVLSRRGLCCACNQWYDIAVQSRMEPGRSLRFKGNCFYVSPALDVKPHQKGFGGRMWRVKFSDGRKLESDNLWHQGAIPQSFRDRLPDNVISMR
jgi:hypothetical protein